MDSVSGISEQARSSLPFPKSAQGPDRSFKDTLSHYLNDVNGLIQEAGDAANKMVKGEINDIHEVIIAGQKASIALEMVVEIRNKLLDSYREFMRMQV